MTIAQLIRYLAVPQLAPKEIRDWFVAQGWVHRRGVFRTREGHRVLAAQPEELRS